MLHGPEGAGALQGAAAADAAADWVGELEGRAGLSLVPDSQTQWDAGRNVYIKEQRPGIWAAMLAKARAPLEVSYGKATDERGQGCKGADGFGPQERSDRCTQKPICVRDSSATEIAPR